MPMREPHPQALVPLATAMGAGHVRCRQGFIDEYRPLRLEIKLVVEPILALDQDIGVVLFGRVAGLFCA